jgi:hypothetical protein
VHPLTRSAAGRRRRSREEAELDLRLPHEIPVRMSDW